MIIVSFLVSTGQALFLRARYNRKRGWFSGLTATLMRVPTLNLWPLKPFALKTLFPLLLPFRLVIWSGFVLTNLYVVSSECVGIRSFVDQLAVMV